MKTKLTPAAVAWIRAKRAALRADAGVLAIRFHWCTVPKIGSGSELDGLTCRYRVRGIGQVSAGSFDLATDQPFRFA